MRARLRRGDIYAAGGVAESEAVLVQEWGGRPCPPWIEYRRQAVPQPRRAGTPAATQSAPRGRRRQVEDERRAFADTFALSRQIALHFLCHDEGGVQAEAMPLAARGESVGEKFGERFRGHADPVVLDHEL